MKDEALTGQLNKLLTHRRDLVLAIAVAGVGVLVALFLVVGQISAILDLRTQVQVARQEQQLLQQKNQIPQEASSTPLLSQEAAINAALSDSKPLTQLLTALSGVVDTAQVAVTKVNLSPGLISTESAKVAAAAPVSNSTIPGVDIMKIQISVEGGFQQINSFLELLDRMSPLVIVNVFKLQDLNAAEGEITQFEATVTLDTYFYTQSVAATLSQELPPVDADTLQVVQQIASFTRTTSSLPTQVIGGGVEDLFGLSQSELEQALQNVGSGANPVPTTLQPTPSVVPNPTSTPSTATGSGQTGSVVIPTPSLFPAPTTTTPIP